MQIMDNVCKFRKRELLRIGKAKLLALSRSISALKAGKWQE